MTQQWRCAPTGARLDVRYRPRRNPSSSGCFLRLAYFSRAAGLTDAPASSPRFILSDAPTLVNSRLVDGSLQPGAKYRLAVPLLQRTERTFSAMILGCGD
jgi:hypothetical protein